MKIGSKVICINDTIDADKIEQIKNDFENWIKKDTVYTIRAILDNDGIVTGVLLEEVYNLPKFFKLLNRYQEPAFATWRFANQKVEVAQLEEIYEEVI